MGAKDAIEVIPVRTEEGVGWLREVMAPGSSGSPTIKRMTFIQMSYGTFGESKAIE